MNRVTMTTVRQVSPRGRNGKHDLNFHQQITAVLRARIPLTPYALVLAEPRMGTGCGAIGWFTSIGCDTRPLTSSSVTERTDIEVVS